MCVLLYKKNKKKLLPRSVLSYISTWEFQRIFEKCEKHSTTARAPLSCSLLFLKLAVGLYNSTMHSMRFLFLNNSPSVLRKT